MNAVYLDTAASAPLAVAAADAMRPWLDAPAGNPASAHHAGRRARRALEDARELVAARLDAHPDEIVFTSGATEANNLALAGPVGLIVGSPVEHPCVAGPLERLAARMLPVSPEGIVPADVLLPADASLIAVMLVNHETGAVMPVRELAARRPAAAAFHCDAAQAIGKLPVSFRELGVSTLTVSGHKCGGPVGIGALLVRRGANVQPLFLGGHQQAGRRPGTESVVLAVGLAAAIDDAVEHLAERVAVVRRLRERLLARLRTEATPLTVNGPNDGVPHILNVSFPGCPADGLVVALDLDGVACSAGSACSSGSLRPSPVLRAMGLPDDRLRSAVRLSLHHTLAEADIDTAADRIARAVSRLRAG